MAATIGKNGGVVVNGSTITFIDEWTLSTKLDTVEVTSFGDESKVRVQTFRDWSADVRGTLDRSDAVQNALLSQFEDGALAAVVLRLKTGVSSYWQGSAILRSGSVRSQVANKVSVEFSFDGAGQLSYTAGG